ncbi:MAG: hypothetical protein AAF558_02160 [Verrucomicrobiota bacterium]
MIRILLLVLLSFAGPHFAKASDGLFGRFSENRITILFGVSSAEDPTHQKMYILRRGNTDSEEKYTLEIKGGDGLSANDDSVLYTNRVDSKEIRDLYERVSSFYRTMRLKDDLTSTMFTITLNSSKSQISGVFPMSSIPDHLLSKLNGLVPQEHKITRTSKTIKVAPES